MFSRSHFVVPAVIAVAVALPVSQAAADPTDLRSPDARTPVEQISSGGPTDLRSPDARTPVTTAVTASKVVDLRSENARTPVTPTDSSPKFVDLRSPDAVDGPGGSRHEIPVQPAIVRVSTPAVDSGFQWDDAGIGAGLLFALLILPAGGYAAMAAHRRSAGGSPLAH